MLEKHKDIPSLKGYYISNKSGAKFHYNSLTELAMMIHLDDNGFKWHKNTKLYISYLFEGKTRKYIPDFLIEQTPFGGKILLEIKGSNDKAELIPKCKAAEIYCTQNNMTFILVPYDKVRKLVNWNRVHNHHYQRNKKI